MGLEDLVGSLNLGVTLFPQTRTFLKKQKNGSFLWPQTPLQFSQMYLICVLFCLFILVVVLPPPTTPVSSPLTPSLWGTGEVRDLGSSSPSLSVYLLLYHLAVLLFNIAPKVF